jgi:hypothetical protein
MNKSFVATLFLILIAAALAGQTAPESGGIRLAPARIELEMAPGTETTFVVTLDSAQSVRRSERILVTLSDFNITREGRVRFQEAGSRSESATSWIVYSPAEAVIRPGRPHSVRVTVTVPKDAKPGDHIAALVVEPRPESLKLLPKTREMRVRYRMASIVYVKVPQLTRRGSLENLQAEVRGDAIVITPTLKNEGNSLVRPLASLRIIDSTGKSVLELPSEETFPVLANSELVQPLEISRKLASGKYTVRYTVDFQDGQKIKEGITELIVPE